MSESSDTLKNIYYKTLLCQIQNYSIVIEVITASTSEGEDND